MNSAKNYDLDKIRALECLLKSQYGYIDDLKKNPGFDDARIREFCTMGFIKTGWTEQSQTYRVLPFAFDFFAIVR